MSTRDDWETPAALFEALNERYSFTLDPCSTDENAKCAKYYTAQDDGLQQSWAGEVVFCNPPYGRQIGRWVEKCAKEAASAVVVMLIPARTDTAYFHEFIYHRARIEFIRGRLKFERGGATWPRPVPFYAGLLQ
jgi:site-specific DNA-methyltransferase (adenine-specific)